MILINNHLRQEDLEKSVSDRLRHLLDEVDSSETELNGLVKKEIELSREINDLTLERDIRVKIYCFHSYF
jgi:hypothetical protein